MKENTWWIDQLRDAYYYGDDFTKTTDLASIEARVTSDHIQASAKRFFTPDNYVLGVMKPKSATAAPAR